MENEQQEYQSSLAPIVMGVIVLCCGIFSHKQATERIRAEEEAVEVTYSSRETIAKLEESLQETQDEVLRLQEELEHSKYYEDYQVTVTAYTLAPDETTGDGRPAVYDEEPKVGWTIAVSRDLIHLLGKRVYIEGVGVRRANDLMNERYTQRIDVLVPTKEYARKFGVKKDVRISALFDPEEAGS